MNKYIFVLLKIFISFIPIIIYAPVFNGTPLWDDAFFIFDRFYDQHFEHSLFWIQSVWPFFDSTTLILYNLFGVNTSLWHITNFVIHIVNGILVGLIVSHFKPKLKTPMTLLFWVHPMCVLSVAWIIQLKTLLSMFFALVSIYLMLTKSNRKSIYFLCVLLFIFSVTSKSATVMLPFMAFAWCLLKKNWRIHILKTIPFVLVSILSLYRMSFNDLLQTTVKNSEAKIPTLIVEEPPLAINEEVIVAEGPNTELPKAFEKSEPTEHAISTDEPKSAPLLIPDTPIDKKSLLDDIFNIPIEINQIKDFMQLNKLKIIGYTTSYYVASAWLPYDLTPIHSSYRGGFNFKNYFGFFIIILSLVFALFRFNWPLICLLSQIGLLLPFLGLIIAPYMHFSIVSEQHVYIALPFTLLLQFILLDKMFKRHQVQIYSLLFVVLSALSASYAPTFKNEEHFFRRVLSVYPYDRLSALNLANFYFKIGSHIQAEYVLKKALAQAEEHPYLKEDVMHAYILKTYERLKQLKNL